MKLIMKTIVASSTLLMSLQPAHAYKCCGGGFEFRNLEVDQCFSLSGMQEVEEMEVICFQIIAQAGNTCELAQGALLTDGKRILCALPAGAKWPPPGSTGPTYPGESIKMTPTQEKSLRPFDREEFMRSLLKE